MRRPSFALGLAVLMAASDAPAASLRSGANAWCAKSRHGARDAVWAHRERRGRPGRAARSFPSARSTSGRSPCSWTRATSPWLRNPMDLAGRGAALHADGGGYSVSRLDLALEPDTGTRLSLTRRRLGARGARLRVPVLRQELLRGLRQLGRQRDVRREGRRLHRAQHGPARQRSAARRAPARRPQPRGGRRRSPCWPRGTT